MLLTHLSDGLPVVVQRWRDGRSLKRIGTSRIEKRVLSVSIHAMRAHNHDFGDPPLL